MTPRSRQRALVAVARSSAIALAPLVLGKFGVSLLNDIGIGALVALGLVLLTGIGGATSFGQAAFVGIAAYASAWLMHRARRLALARPRVRARAHRRSPRSRSAC